MVISTSILNSTNREESLLELNNTKTEYIHIDVMDGIFVSDKQFSIEEIKRLNDISKKKLDVHLMVEDPLKYINELSNLNIEYITFQVEIDKDINEIINTIRNLGYKPGLAIKPDTNLDVLTPYLYKIDLILVMSVEPGKGGQAFLEETPKRIEEVNKIKKSLTLIEVDGGINDKTIYKLKKANIAVVGSYIINSDNYKKTIKKLIKKSESTDIIYLFTDTLIKIFLVASIVSLFFYLSYSIKEAYNYSVNGYDGFLCKAGCNTTYGMKAFWGAFLGQIILLPLELIDTAIPVIILSIIFAPVRLIINKILIKTSK